ncbi:hypothetical protein JCM10212_006728 [Sporobolomyces blumeae]
MSDPGLPPVLPPLPSLPPLPAGLPPLPAGLPPVPPGFNLQRIFDMVSATRRYEIAWFSILCFDTLATFPDEYRFLWKNSKWTLLRVVFFLNRWGSLVVRALMLIMNQATISSEVCSRIYWFGAFGGIYIAFVCACIAAIRVWPLHNKTKTILCLLIFMLIAQLCLTTGPTSQLIPSSPPAPLRALGFRGCGVIANKNLAASQVTIFWISLLAFDTVILLLIFLKSVQVSRAVGKVPIVQRLLHDGFLYFCVITSSNIVAVVFVLQDANLALKPFQVSCLLTLTALMCSRLVLSLFKRGPTTKISGLASSGSTSAPTPRSWFTRSRRGQVHVVRSAHAVPAPKHNVASKNHEAIEGVPLEEIVAAPKLSRQA